MKNPEDKSSLATHRGRVVLYAPCYADAEAAMSLAVELARQSGAELHGILVHDRATFAAAGGTISAVVSYSGVCATGVSTEDMLKAFRTDASRFRDRLQRQAREATISAAFQEAEGRLAEAMQTTAQSGDVIVVGFKPMFRGGEEIVVVLEKGRTVPEFATKLASALKKQLVVLASGAEQSDLLARLDRMSPAAVILAGAPARSPSLARIVEAARCPVIVYSAPT